MEKEKNKIQDIVDSSLLSLGIEIGLSTGIYKAFEKLGRKCTCEKLAETAGLNERYVREWLGGMVAAELIYLNDNSEYILPTPADVIESQCKTTLMRILFDNFDQVIDAMKVREKSGYEFYDIKGLAELMITERQKPGSLFCVDDNFIKENIAPVLEWVKKDNGCTIDIMDFGCGNGIVTIQMARNLPDVNIVGIDENSMILERAKTSAQDANVQNCSFEVCRGEDLTETYNSSFDIVVMMDVLHDLADPDTVMTSIKKVLKPGGYLIAIDPAVHSNHKDNVGNIAVGGYYFVSMFVCLPSSLSRDPKVGHGIGWGYENRKSYIEKCGFKLCTLTEEEDVNESKRRIIGKLL